MRVAIDALGIGQPGGGLARNLPPLAHERPRLSPIGSVQVRALVRQLPGMIHVGIPSKVHARASGLETVGDPPHALARKRPEDQPFVIGLPRVHHDMGSIRQKIRLAGLNRHEATP